MKAEELYRAYWLAWMEEFFVELDEWDDIPESERRAWDAVAEAVNK